MRGLRINKLTSLICVFSILLTSPNVIFAEDNIEDTSYQNSISTFSVGDEEDMSDAEITISIPENIELEYYSLDGVESYFGCNIVNSWGKLDAYDKQLCISAPSTVTLTNTTDNSTILVKTQLYGVENIKSFETCDNTVAVSFEDLYNYMVVNNDVEKATSMVRVTLLDGQDLHNGTYVGTMTYTVSTEQDPNKSDYYSTGLGTYIDNVFYPYTDESYLGTISNTKQQLGSSAKKDAITEGCINGVWCVNGGQNSSKPYIFKQTASSGGDLSKTRGDIELTMYSSLNNKTELKKIILPYGTISLNTQIAVADLQFYLPNTIKQISYNIFRNTTKFEIYYDGTVLELLNALACHDLYRYFNSDWKGYILDKSGNSTTDSMNTSIFSNSAYVSKAGSYCTFHVRTGTGTWGTVTNIADILSSIFVDFTGGSSTVAALSAAEYNLKSADLSTYAEQAVVLND